MRILQLLTILTMTLFFAGCSNSKLSKAADKLTDATWELEYISGPRIAFQGLYPDKKPTIAFNTKQKEVGGNTGCNSFSTKYSMKGEAISFAEPGPITLMFCPGEGEQVFLKTMASINKFNFDKDGKLELLMNEVAVMRFKRTN